VLKDLIPFIDQKFRTIPNAAHRAIAGTSMGAGQAMNIGLNNLDTIANVGAFSGGVGGINIDSSYGGIFQNADSANSRIKVLWIGSGTEDRAINGVRAAHKTLSDHGIRHIAYEAPGGHVWGVWRGFLKEFATKLFRDN
jgi:enterochelin esterase family protein